MAGAASVAAPAAPIPVTLRKSLLFIESIPVGECVAAFLARPLQPAWNNRFPISIPNYTGKRKSPAFLRRPGIFLLRLKTQSAAPARAYHEAGIGVFGNL